MQTLVEKLYYDLKPGDWVFLHGDMGAGKTFFTQQLCEKIGVQDAVTSPTYTILNVYSADYNGIQTILHLDFYRIKNPFEICTLGLEQVFNVDNTVAFFEWPSLLSEEDWKIFFQTTGCQQPLRVHNIDVTRLTYL